MKWPPCLNDRRELADLLQLALDSPAWTRYVSARFTANQKRLGILGPEISETILELSAVVSVDWDSDHRNFRGMLQYKTRDGRKISIALAMDCNQRQIYFIDLQC